MLLNFGEKKNRAGSPAQPSHGRGCMQVTHTPTFGIFRIELLYTGGGEASDFIFPLLSTCSSRSDVVDDDDDDSHGIIVGPSPIAIDDSFDSQSEVRKCFGAAAFTIIYPSFPHSSPLSPLLVTITRCTWRQIHDCCRCRCTNNTINASHCSNGERRLSKAFSCCWCLC